MSNFNDPSMIAFAYGLGVGRWAMNELMVLQVCSLSSKLAKMIVLFLDFVEMSSPLGSVSGWLSLSTVATSRRGSTTQTRSAI